MLAYMMFHPGKKLSFMGNELGQFIEWNYQQGLDWMLLDFEAHRKFQEYVRALNQIYLSHAALWQLDDSWEGFTWLIADDSDNNVLAFQRTDKSGNQLLAVLNFAPVKREDYRIGVCNNGKYTNVFSSDALEYGGTGTDVPDAVMSEKIPWNGKDRSISITIPPMSATLFRVPKKRGKKGTSC